MVTLTARQYYDKALQLAEGFGLKVAIDDPGIRKKLLTIASYLQLAIEKSREPSVYRVILQVPWDSIDLGGFADVVTDLRVRAEGNLHF